MATEKNAKVDYFRKSTFKKVETFSQSRLVIDYFSERNRLYTKFWYKPLLTGESKTSYWLAL
jgi:hypothetical protein